MKRIVFPCAIISLLLAISCKTTNSSKPFAESDAALTIYSEAGFQGNRIEVNKPGYYSNSDVSELIGSHGIHSFKLAKGYALVIGDKTPGAGTSDSLIANNNSIDIKNLSGQIQANGIHYFRMSKLKPTQKKGYTWNQRPDPEANAWKYQWSVLPNNIPSAINWTPMQWGLNYDHNAIETVLHDPTYTEVLGFNEIDRCGSQAAKGFSRDKCTVLEDRGRFSYTNASYIAEQSKNVEKYAARIGSPAPHEDAGRDFWLASVLESAKKQNVRMDFVALHWYDWLDTKDDSSADHCKDLQSCVFQDMSCEEQRSLYSNLREQPYPKTGSQSPEAIVARLKKYLEDAYKKYQKPIWLTEFNANVRRKPAVQLAFLELALPMLEKLDFVGRYNYYQPNSGTGAFKLSACGYQTTEIGKFYFNFQSGSSLKKDVYLGNQKP